MYETKAQPAAPFVAIGMVMSLVGWPLLAAAGYVGLVRATAVGTTGDPGPSIPMAFLGWSLVLVGGVLIGIGVYRLVQHADRAAGVRFTRDPLARTVWTTAQPAEVLPPDPSRTE